MDEVYHGRRKTVLRERETEVLPYRLVHLGQSGRHRSNAQGHTGMAFGLTVRTQPLAAHRDALRSAVRRDKVEGMRLPDA